MFFTPEVCNQTGELKTVIYYSEEGPRNVHGNGERGSMFDSLARDTELGTDCTSLVNRTKILATILAKRRRLFRLRRVVFQELFNCFSDVLLFLVWLGLRIKRF